MGYNCDSKFYVLSLNCYRVCFIEKNFARSRAHYVCVCNKSFYEALSFFDIILIYNLGNNGQFRYSDVSIIYNVIIVTGLLYVKTCILDWVMRIFLNCTLDSSRQGLQRVTEGKSIFMWDYCGCIDDFVVEQPQRSVLNVLFHRKEHDIQCNNRYCFTLCKNIYLRLSHAYFLGLYAWFLAPRSLANYKREIHFYVGLLRLYRRLYCGTTAALCSECVIPSQGTWYSI